MNFFEVNLSFMEAIQPHMVKLLREYVLPKEERVQVLRIKEGKKTATILQDNNHHYQVSSLFDSQGESQEWLKSFAFNKSLFTLVFGCGFAVYFDHIFKNKELEAYIVCVEPNLELAWKMFHDVDLTPYLKTNRMIFLLGNQEDMLKEMGKLIGSTAIYYAVRPSLIFLPQTKFDHVETYSQIGAKLIDKIKTHAFYIAGDILDSMQGVENTIFNLDEVLENPYFRVLKDAYKGKTAVIVSTGPSLDAAIEELKKLKGKALVICAESAIIPLLEHGIVPDAVSIIERINETYEYHIKDRTFPQDLVLLGLTVIVNKVFDEWPGIKIPIFPFAETHSIHMHELCNSSGNLYPGISASHMAFNFARYVGCERIILVAQDLCYGIDGNSHSLSSAYGDTRGKISQEDLVYVKDNYDQMRPAKDIWDKFRKWYEGEIQNMDIPVINTTVNGAKIEGTSLMPLDEVVKKYCQDEVVPLHVYIKEHTQRLSWAIEEKRQVVNQFYNWIEELHDKHKELHEKVLSNIKNILQDIEALENETYQSIDRIVKRTLENQDILNFINQDKFLRFMFQTHVMSMHFYSIKIGTVDTKEKLKDMLKVLYNLFDLIDSGESKIILPVLQNCLKRLHTLQSIYQ